MESEKWLDVWRERQQTLEVQQALIALAQEGNHKRERILSTMEEKLKEILDYYRARDDRGSQETVVQLLREVQELYGFIPPEARRLAAEACGVKEALVSCLVKRYPSLKEAAYRHTITACTGQRCGRKDGAALNLLVDGQLLPHAAPEQIPSLVERLRKL